MKKVIKVANKHNIESDTILNWIGNGEINFEQRDGIYYVDEKEVESKLIDWSNDLNRQYTQLSNMRIEDVSIKLAEYLLEKNLNEFNNGNLFVYVLISHSVNRLIECLSVEEKVMLKKNDFDEEEEFIIKVSYIVRTLIDMKESLIDMKDTTIISDEDFRKIHEFANKITIKYMGVHIDVITNGSKQLEEQFNKFMEIARAA